MIKTGIEKIDKEIKIEEGNTVLLTGSMEQVESFPFQFIAEGIKDGEAILYITFRNPANKITEKLKKRYMEGKIIFIDVTGKAQPTNNIIIVNPSDLNSILIHALKVIKRENSIKRCYIEGYSKLLDYIPPDLAVRFSAVFMREISKCRVACVIEINKMLADKFKRFFDIVIEMNEKTKIMTESFEKEI